MTRAKITTFLILSLWGAFLLSKAYREDSYFLSTLHVGQNFVPNMPQVVRWAGVPTESPWGYDGQFYAVMATGPLLNEKEVVSGLDFPKYRGRRIGLPLLAWVLGLGVDRWVLHVYSVLNFFFYVLFIYLLLSLMKGRGLQIFLGCAALCFSTGVSVSLARALVDLPAVTLLLAALRWPSFLALGCSMGVLTKETNLPSCMLLLLSTGKLRAKSAALVVAPIVLWILYLNIALKGTPMFGGVNFTWPFLGVWQKLTGFSWDFETGGVLAILSQSAYLLLHPRPKDPVWLLALPFIALMTVLAGPVWVEQLAYARVLLPIGVSFNLLLAREELGVCYGLWFALGNMGLMGFLGSL